MSPLHPMLNLCVFSWSGTESKLKVIETLSITATFNVTLTNSLNGALNTNELMFWTEIMFYPYSDNHLTLVFQSIRSHNKISVFLLERSQNPFYDDWD